MLLKLNKSSYWSLLSHARISERENIPKGTGSETHSEVDSVQVGIAFLKPVVKVLGVVCGVTFPVGGHAEDGQGVVDLREACQLRL